jgi:hypothetical protein
MVQILPPPTHLGSEIGQALGRGLEAGGEQAFQRAQVQKAIQSLEAPKQGASSFDTMKELISALGGVPGAEKYIGQILPLYLAQQQYGISPQGEKTPSTGQTGITSAPKQESVFNLRTPQQIEAEARRAVQYGGDFGKRVGELQALNAQSEMLRNNLEKLAVNSGISSTRMPELFEFAKSRPDITDPASLVAAAKKEFEKLDKYDIPGVWSRLIPGAPTREEAIKNLIPYAESMKDLGREQEARTSLAEKGLTQTEINSAFYPLNKSASQSLSKLPPGPNKHQGSEEGIETRNNYVELLKKNPKLVEKQNEQLENFFNDHLTPNSSLLVFRDNLWRKGYDWRQINDAFNAAYPDKSVLSDTQKSELPEMAQAPIPSMREIFSSWRRFGKFLQGAR